MLGEGYDMLNFLVNLSVVAQSFLLGPSQDLDEFSFPSKTLCRCGHTAAISDRPGLSAYQNMLHLHANHLFAIPIVQEYV